MLFSNSAKPGTPEPSILPFRYWKLSMPAACRLKMLKSATPADTTTISINSPLIAPGALLTTHLTATSNAISNATLRAVLPSPRQMLLAAK